MSHPAFAAAGTIAPAAGPIIAPAGAVPVGFVFVDIIITYSREYVKPIFENL